MVSVAILPLYSKYVEESACLNKLQGRLIGPLASDAPT